MEKGLFYSDEALLNRILFLSDFNEVSIVVEDEHREYEYESIFNRLFSYKLKIINIFPMKGKPGVKKAFEEFGESYNGKPIVYLVDGDFDLIMDKDMVIHPNYIYLDKYNIESYYIDKAATLRFMAGKMKKRQKEIIEQIDYDAWEIDTYQKLEKLFINYIIAQKAFPEEKNVGIPPYIYIDNQGCIDNGKIEMYINKLKSRTSNYLDLYSFYYERFELNFNADSSKIICGKYLVASLAQYLRKKTNVTFKEDDFRYYLVGEFSIKKLDFIKERVIDILKKSA